MIDKVAASSKDFLIVNFLMMEEILSASGFSLLIVADYSGICKTSPP